MLRLTYLNGRDHTSTLYVDVESWYQNDLGDLILFSNESEIGETPRLMVPFHRVVTIERLYDPPQPGTPIPQAVPATWTDELGSAFIVPGWPRQDAEGEALPAKD